MKPQRRGYTLIETLVAFAMTATLLGTISLTIHSLYQADQRLRDSIDRQRDVQRLSTALRADVHQAVAATVKTVDNGEMEGSRLRLTMPNKTVVYALQGTRVQRTDERDGATVHHESYDLPHGSTPGWEVDRNAHLPLVTLQWNLPAPGTDGGGRETGIQAAMGMLEFKPAESEPEDEDPNE